MNESTLGALGLSFLVLGTLGSDLFRETPGG